MIFKIMCFEVENRFNFVPNKINTYDFYTISSNYINVYAISSRALGSVSSAVFFARPTIYDNSYSSSYFISGNQKTIVCFWCGEHACFMYSIIILVNTCILCYIIIYFFYYSRGLCVTM